LELDYPLKDTQTYFMAQKKGKWFSVSEAVSVLGFSDKTIRRRIKSGVMTSKKVGKSYMVFIPDDTPGRDDTPKEEKFTGSTKEDRILNLLAKQLEEKDRQIKEINDRLHENNILLMEFKRLLPAPKPEETTGEIYEVKEKKKLHFNWKNISLGFLIVATLGLVSYILVTSGFISF